MVSIESFSFLNESLQQPVLDGVNRGLELSSWTLALTFILELFSIPTVRAVLKQRDGKSLYLMAILVNLYNHYVFGVPVYVVASILFCRNEAASDHFVFFVRAAGVLLIHSITYYGVHKAFHASPKFYVYHRYHHRFNSHVPPISANAVSAVEYIVAYIIPFALGAFVVEPHISELNAAIYIVSICNLLVHTPRLEKLSKQLPPIFVTTHGHIEHHKRLTTNYAAPTINVDWMVEQFQATFVAKQT